MDLPEGEIAEFKPVAYVNEECGITEYVFEDAAYVAQPVFPNLYHYIDWMVALDDGRLVGIQFWSKHDLPQPPQQEE